jgi:hypothetical protein
MQSTAKPTDASPGTDVADVGDGSSVESGTGGGDQPADECAASASLVALCRKHSGKLPTDKRAYSVKCGDVTRYVFSNSPGQAALEVCEVERVKDKDLTKAAFEAMGVKS